MTITREAILAAAIKAKQARLDKVPPEIADQLKQCESTSDAIAILGPYSSVLTSEELLDLLSLVPKKELPSVHRLPRGAKSLLSAVLYICGVSWSELAKLCGVTIQAVSQNAKRLLGDNYTRIREPVTTYGSGGNTKSLIGPELSEVYFQTFIENVDAMMSSPSPMHAAFLLEKLVQAQVGSDAETT